MEWRILAQKEENCFFSSLFKFKGKAPFFFLIWYVVLTQTHIKYHLKSLKNPNDRVYLHRFFFKKIQLVSLEAKIFVFSKAFSVSLKQS